MTGRVVVVGAGISGLSVAYGLLQQSRALGLDPDLLVLEQSAHPGGQIQSQSIGGYLCEWGADGFLNNSPPTLQLCRELGLEDRLLPSAAAAGKRRFLQMNGALQLLPASPPAFLKSPILPLRARLRALLEPWIRRGTGEESVAAFFRRRLGPDIAATFADALVTGVYGGDAEEISVDAAYPRIRAMEREQGSLLKGMLALARERRKSGAMAGPPRSHSFVGGLSELTQALARALGEARIRTGTQIEAIQPLALGWRIQGASQSWEARHLVLALPPHRSAALIRGFLPQTADRLEALPMGPIAVACFGLRRQQVLHPLDGFGFLVPGREASPLLGCLFSSSIYPGRAPEGRVLLRSMLGGRRHPEVLDGGESGVLQEAWSRLRPLLGLQGEPEMSRAVLHRPGIPQYTLGHAQRVSAIEAEVGQWPGLSLIGNAFHGVSVNDCLRNGLALGQQLARR